MLEYTSNINIDRRAITRPIVSMQISFDIFLDWGKNFYFIIKDKICCLEALAAQTTGNISAQHLN